MIPATVQSSSSDDEDSIYLNSAARLKALKQEQLLLRTNNNIRDTEGEKTQEKITDFNAGIPMRTRSKMSNAKGNISNQEESFRGPRRQTETRIDNLETSDSDLEIVSVEEHQPDCILVCDNSTSESYHEDENYEMSIKILWQSRKLHYMNICRNEQFRKVFEYFAKIEQVSVDEIIITNKNKIIKKNDTPASVDLSIIDILEGGIVKRNGTNSRNSAEEDEDEDICVIKIQTGAKKNLNIRVKRDQNFKSLLEKCAQELGVEESKIKLYFDGELISLTDTPNSLDIEDEACFDIRLPSQ